MHAAGTTYCRRLDCAAAMRTALSAAQSGPAERYKEYWRDVNFVMEATYRVRSRVRRSVLGSGGLRSQCACKNRYSHCFTSTDLFFIDMYACPFPGCTETYKTPSGIRKHWKSSNGHPGEVPRLCAEEIAILDEKDMEATGVVELSSDQDLIRMMGLCDGQVDTRSSGRFARLSRLSAQQSGSVYSCTFTFIVRNR